MSTSATESEPWSPSRRALIFLVALVLLAGIASGVLESGLGGEPIVDYDDAIVDIAAVDELATRGIDPCPEVGEPVIPDDLVNGLQGTQCKAFDTSGGAGWAIIGVAVLGAVIVAASGNRFGLYLILISLGLVLGGGVASAYAARGIVFRPGSLPAPELVTFLGGLGIMVLMVVMVPHLILVFPTGSFFSQRWRWVARAAWLPALIVTISTWFQPLGIHDIRNPLPYQLPGDLAIELAGFGWTFWVALVTISFAGLLWRFVKARGQERQQLKWVAYAVVVAVVINSLSLIVPGFPGTVQLVTNLVIVPAAALNAIFKYRLYDIDRIINRTVVYGLVTLIVAGLFVAVIVVPQTLLVGTQGLEPGFVVMVALATLVVAAVFNPLRRRIQRIVDRRFNRTNFDARQIVEGLQDRLKEPSDVQTLVRDVSSIVETTMEPSQLGVWTNGARS